MAEPRDLSAQINRLVEERVAMRGGPPYDGGMEPRIAKLEHDVADIRVDIGSIKTFLPTLATKAEMHKEFNVQTWRLIGALALVASAAVLVARLFP